MSQINLEQITDSIVLVRVGYDIPNLEDVDRIIDSKKTIQTLLEQNNKIVLLTKWGRPKGFEDNLSTKKLSTIISRVLNFEVKYLNQFECSEFSANKELSIVQQIHESEKKVILLENLHFDFSETSKDTSIRKEQAKKYSILGKYIVDECFISSHRKEATNLELKEYLPFAFGLAYLNEKFNLDKIKYNPERPFHCILGGAKLETKLPLIRKMLVIADKIMLGGLISLTYVYASNQLGLTEIDLKDSVVDFEYLPNATEDILQYADKLVLPQDFVFANSEGKDTARDIGVKTRIAFDQILESAKTIFWNGPVGQLELPEYALGSLYLINSITKNNASFKALGGGDTNLLLDEISKEKFDFISMGGGASLEYLANIG